MSAFPQRLSSMNVQCGDRPAIHLQSAAWLLEAGSCPSQEFWHGGMLTEAQGLGSRTHFVGLFLLVEEEQVPQNSYSGRRIHRELPCVAQGARAPGLVLT